VNDQPPAPRWLLLRDVPRTAALLRNAFGGARWRQVIKMLAVPHLVVTGSSVTLGISPDCGTRRMSARVRSGILQAAWLLAASLFPAVRQGVPWCLRSKGIVRWRLVNLARSPADRRSSTATLPVCLHALALADEAVLELEARVDRRYSRLVMAYERDGFSLASSTEAELILRRPAGTWMAR